MLHITITGIDKSGKSTLIKSFMQATHYEHYVVDRDPSTYHFFNVLRHRLTGHEELSRYWSFQKKFKQYVDLAILLKVNEEDWEHRCDIHNEPSLVGDLKFTEHQNMIEHFFDKARYNNILKLNTTDSSIDDCVNAIKDKIKCL